MTCAPYAITVAFDIPVEIVMVDCCGYIYTVKSTIHVPSGTIPALTIPLGFNSSNVTNGSAFLYLKVKVRLCEQATLTSGSNVTGVINILVEGCVQKFMPYGLIGDPNNRLGPYFCG
jgi:hypothetical protein